MSLFRREYIKLEDENKKINERKEDFKKLKNENLKQKDILALIIAMFQLIIPFALGIIVIYFIVIIFITKIWMN